MNSTNIVLLAVLVEVRMEDCEVRFTSACPNGEALSVQHLLILVKVLLSVLIPDEPDWVRKKMERTEFKSLQALREQVNHKKYSVRHQFCVFLKRVTMELLLLLFSRGHIQEAPDCISTCGGSASHALWC